MVVLQKRFHALRELYFFTIPFTALNSEFVIAQDIKKGEGTPALLMLTGRINKRRWKRPFMWVSHPGGGGTPRKIG